jgi:hypothetical protein
MSAVEPSPPLDPYQWGTVLGTVSLDLAQPYLAAMGLQLPSGSAFLAGLRKLIQDFRPREVRDAREALLFAPTVLAWARKEFGPAFAEHLHRWGENVFQCSGADGASVFLWNSIVRRGRLDGSRDVEPPPEFIRLVRQQLAKRDRPSIGSPQPTTAWDQEVYARQHYDHMRNPGEFIQSTISHFNFVTAWTEALQAAGPSVDLAAVYHWGLSQAERLGMPLDRVGKPGSWPALPPTWKER